MAKYDGLRDHLRRSGASRVVMTFDEVAAVVPGGLPPSAFEHAAWWSNSGRSHVEAQAWLDAGYRTAELSLEHRRVTFVREDVAHLPGR